MNETIREEVASENIVFRQTLVLTQDVGFGCTMCMNVQNIIDRQACPADYWLARHYLRVGGYAVK